MAQLAEEVKYSLHPERSQFQRVLLPSRFADAAAEVELRALVPTAALPLLDRTARRQAAEAGQTVALGARPLEATSIWTVGNA